jgi:hypothetical protein
MSSARKAAGYNACGAGTAGVPQPGLLRLLERWCGEHGGLDPGIRLREAGVPVEFWSRVGD